MKARRLIKAACGVLAVATLALSGAAGAQDIKPMTLKLAHGATPDQAVGMAMQRMADLIKEKSGGKVTVETHLAGSLYNERTSIEALINGAVDMGGGSNANWGAFTRTLLFMDLPYVFRDDETFKRVMAGEVGAEIRKRFERDGFKMLMILNNGGFRDIVNNKKPVKVPADLKGMKIRTTASPVEIAMFRGWGAIPTSIDWAEVYNALSSGVVDGEFVMPTWLATAKHYEVLKHATQNQAVIGVQTIAMRQDRFDSLPKAVQDIILQSAAEAEAYGNQIDDELSVKARQYAEGLGVQFYKPTEEEMKLWRDSVGDVWKELEPRLDKDLMKIVSDSQK